MRPSAVFPREKVQAGLIIIGVFALLILFLSSAYIFYSPVAETDVQYLQFLLINTFRWLPWAFIAPLVFWLAKRIPLGRKKWFFSVALHFMGGLACAALKTLITTLLFLVTHSWWIWPEGLAPSLMPLFGQHLVRNLHLNILIYGIILGVTFALSTYRKSREREIRANRFESQLAQSKLQILKLQIQPHFLFNTLNAISALITRDPQRADRMLMQLSLLLRTSVEQSSRQEDTLNAELFILRQYLDIMKIRLEDRLEYEMDTPPETLKAFLPHFILQPLVENAIRHGIAPRAEGGKVRLSSLRRNDRLLIEISDNGVGLGADTEALLSRGFGLQNTKERLRNLYGSDAGFELKNLPEGGTVLTLELPFHTEALNSPENLERV